MYRSFLLALIFILCTGCVSFRLEKYDQQTVDQVELSIKSESTTWEILRNVLPDDQLESFRVMHDAEMARLEAWLRYEHSKEVEVEE